MYRDPEAADRMLGRLADLLRLTFARAPEPEAPLHSELEWLGWYLELMQLRFGGRLSIRQEIQSETLNLAVPRLILQPLVENALRHGAAKRAGPAEVMITASRLGERLRLSVVDDGPGVHDPDRAGQNGVGLSNTSERLRVLYGEAGRFSLSNRPEGDWRRRLKYRPVRFRAKRTMTPIRTVIVDDEPPRSRQARGFLPPFCAGVGRRGGRRTGGRAHD